jgi:hypothetical protein
MHFKICADEYIMAMVTETNMNLIEKIKQDE